TGATGAIFQALAPGDHVLAHVDAYYGTSRLLREIFLRWGLQADFIDMSDLAAVKKALGPKTKLAWMETPSNPLLKIVDLAEVAKIVHDAGALCVCDNTWAPILQRPFDLGADFILHSTTKYFGGHCDVLGGMLSFEVKGGRDPAMKVTTSAKIFTRATSLGGVESLIEHRASIEGPGTTSPEGLIRLSIGLENADDLIEDLDQALRL